MVIATPITTIVNTSGHSSRLHKHGETAGAFTMKYDENAMLLCILNCIS
jgi:hypothetical protein